MSTDNELWGATPSSVQDSTAFCTVYDRHATAVYRYAFSRVRDPDAAQDLLQETFLTAWRRRDDIEWATPTLIGWLLVTCRHLSENYLRHSAQSRTDAMEDVLAAGRPGFTSLGSSLAGDPADAVERDFEIRWVLEAIGQLNSTDRELVRLCLIGDTPYAEAAARLGLTVTSATKRISRTRSDLRAMRAIRRKEW